MFRCVKNLRMRIVLRWFAADSWNDFVSHSLHDLHDYIFDYNQNGDAESHVHISLTLYLEYPIRYHAEAYYQATQTF